MILMPEPMTVRTFGDFDLDAADMSLRRDGEIVPLTPKAYSVLEYLVERAGRLVTKQELLDTVWSDTIVGDAVLKVCVLEIRKALGDDPRNATYIQTVHRRGYRFVADVAEVTTPAADVDSAEFAADKVAPTVAGIGSHSLGLVARESSWAQLQRAFERARLGRRQSVFVTGEAGIGKTSLVDAFAEELAAVNGTVVARGQCIEHYGSGEAYLPVLEAIGRLTRGPQSDGIIDVLTRYAPTWIAQMPGLSDRIDASQLREKVMGATRDRMLRELVEALEIVGEARPVVLVFEDLHWSDHSTLDFIALLARRTNAARLMVIATYRPLDVLRRNHPLKDVARGLVGRDGCEQIALAELSAGAIRRLLLTRFPDLERPEEVALLVHERTGGQPLFLAQIIDHLAEKLRSARHLASADEIDLDALRHDVPDGTRQAIETQLDAVVDEDRPLLDVASVIGIEFDAAVVAQASGQDRDDVETRLDRLACTGDVIDEAEPVALADGDIVGAFRFHHSLVRSVVRETIPTARRARLHGKIGRALEELRGQEVRDLAAVLAMHFEAGRNTPRAVDHLGIAADNATRRHAGREALEHLDHAERLVDTLAENDRATRRITLFRRRGLVKRSLGDMPGAAREFEGVVANAVIDGDTRATVEGRLFLASALFWVDRKLCLEAVDRAVAELCGVDDDLFRAHAAGWCGHWSLNLRGWSDEAADACLEAVASARAAGDDALLGLHRVRSSYLENLRGRYGDAVQAADEAIVLATAQDEAFDFMLAHFFRGWALVHGGHLGEALATVEIGRALARRNDHELWIHLFGLIEAQARGQAFDFDGAAACARPALDYTERHPEASGQLGFHGALVLAQAEFGNGDVSVARRRVAAVVKTIEATPHEVDGLLHPLAFSLRSEIALREDDLDEAERTAAKATELAVAAGEATYLGLARAASIRVMAGRGEDERAVDELVDADGNVDAFDNAPLAAWRLQATLAEIATATNRDDVAKAARTNTAQVLRRLCESLNDEELARIMTTSDDFTAFVK